MASAPDDALADEPVRELERLIGRLKSRLMAHEAFRALVQLEARVAEGRPLQALGPSDVARHLESELSSIKDFHAYQLLRKASAELKTTPAVALPALGARIEPPASISPQPVVVEKRPAGATADPASLNGANRPDHTAASAAVAAAFASRSAPPTERAQLPEALTKPPQVQSRPSSAPVATTPIEVSATPAPAAMPAPVAAANPTIPAFQRVDAAGADVLASVARLRAPEAANSPRTVRSPVSPEVAQPVVLTPSLSLDVGPTGLRSQSASMEGTMASMAKAVAVTVAAAGRLTGHGAETAQRPASTLIPALEDQLFVRQRGHSTPAGEAASAAGSAEIRFVAHPTDPLTDSLPPTTIPVPQAAPPLTAPRQGAALAASSHEEASVEIRRPDNLGPQSRNGQRPGGDTSGEGARRVPGVLNRFVKALRRDKN